MREFARIWGATPFFGHDRDGKAIVVSRELARGREDRWRVTWFFPEKGAVYPGGHTEARSFREALRVAVTEYGLLLETAEHLPTARRRRDRDHEDRRRRRR